MSLLEMNRPCLLSYRVNIVQFYYVCLPAVNYDDDESRDTRSRRRMTDDDDTVLDNASVNSQDGNSLSFSLFLSFSLSLSLSLSFCFLSAPLSFSFRPPPSPIFFPLFFSLALILAFSTMEYAQQLITKCKKGGTLLSVTHTSCYFRLVCQCQNPAIIRHVHSGECWVNWYLCACMHHVCVCPCVSEHTCLGVKEMWEICDQSHGGATSWSMYVR